MDKGCRIIQHVIRKNVKRMKIAILYICTGKYDIFWKEFFESYEELFLPNSEKEYFVFTDAEELYAEKNCERIHRIYQEQLGWPKDTLMRFHMFDTISEQLKNLLKLLLMTQFFLFFHFTIHTKTHSALYS